MSKKIEKIIVTVWKETEGLQTIEGAEYEIEISSGKEKRKELSRTWGFRNENGEIVIPPVYSYVWKFEEGISKVCKNGKWGVINKHGEVIVPIIYQTLHLTSDGMLQVQMNGKWGCLKKDGITVIAPRYDYIFPFRSAFAGIKMERKYGFVDLEGKEIIAPSFNEIGQISSDGTVKVRNRTEWQEIVLSE